MSEDNIIEETESGWTMQARTQIIYQDASGVFVDREEFVAERNSELRESDGDGATSGWGAGGWGSGGYGR